MITGASEAVQESVFRAEPSADLVILRAAVDPMKPSYEARHKEYNSLRREFSEREPRHIVFDLSECLIMDSVMIGTMVALTHAARDRGCNAVLVGPSDELTAILGRLMLLEAKNKRAMWAAYDTLRDALADYPW
jgi:hypothetical protein